MTDMLSTLAWKLHAATGLQVYPAPKPVDAALPCLTFQMVSDPMQDQNDLDAASLHASRIQISHIGEYEVVRPYVKIVQDYLEGNKVDFSAALSDGFYLERQEAEKMWVLTKGYNIYWKY